LVRKIHLKVEFRHWAGCSQVPRDKSGIVVICGYELNGMFVGESLGKLVADTFLMFEVAMPKPIDTRHWKMNNKYWTDSIKQIRAAFTEEDWMEGTTDEVLLLPVSTIEWVELPPHVKELPLPLSVYPIPA
jgi:hypothetical protein